MSETNRVEVAYQSEATFATDPTSASTNAIRRTGGSFGLDVGLLESAEVRSDRLTAGTGLGTKVPSGSIEFEASYGAHDDLMAGAMQNSWGSAVSNTGLTLSVSSGAWSGTGIGTGLAVGDVFKVSGTDSGTNDGNWYITSYTDANGFSAVKADDASAASDETSTTGVSIVNAGTIQPGTTRASFLIEESFNDVTVFAKYNGCVIGGASLDIVPDALITGSFTDIQAKTVAYSGTAFDATPTAAATNEILSSVSDVSGVVEASTDVGSFLINNLSWSLNNNVRSLPVVGSGGAPGDIRLGRVQVSGNFSAYLSASTLTQLGKMTANTTTSMRWGINDAAGNYYYFVFPSVKLVNGSPQAGGSDSDVPTPFEFTAFRDGASGGTGTIMKITRIAA